MNTEVERPVGQFVEPLPTGSIPDLRVLNGQWTRLEPLSIQSHGPLLYASGRQDQLWTYMPYGPFEDSGQFEGWLMEKQESRDPWFYAIVDAQSNDALGMAAFMRADAKNGVIEIGNIWFAPSLQRSRQGTEAIYLMMQYAFENLKVRRLEWKCDALNAPSRRAAQRYGFSFEGIFRQHMVIKGRNRDTAWFAIIDKDWPRIRDGFTVWLDRENFDAAGQEKAKLRTQ